MSVGGSWRGKPWAGLQAQDQSAYSATQTILEKKTSPLYCYTNKISSSTIPYNTNPKGTALSKRQDSIYKAELR
jgi:hypothetical protein